MKDILFLEGMLILWNLIHVGILYQNIVLL